MGGFTKLFSRILISSVWSESNETRIVWITLLALTGPDGIAKITLPGLSRLAVVPLPKVEVALRILSSPDPYSRTAEHDGRRLKEVRDEAGNLVGFFLFNYAKHRAVDATGAERQRKHRAKRDRNARQKTEGRRQKAENETAPLISGESVEATTGYGVPEDQRQEYADAVWQAFLAKTGERVTRDMSSLEFDVLKRWMDAGIPLAVVLRGITDTRGKGRMLGYFASSVQEAVEMQRKAVPL
jgi:hypothetical protein